ncbi:hypothetical protein J3459_017352 [Metarhizium acridum]|uniref:uncharacterized protein n=1 Tax=Metarhizium acridum TaxID=92637 RepID=UPI001C6B0EF7|nr:hypothetical protein J3459_017352 [Metarhizium acridum]KAG8418459.1 hypothetical protein J3458_005869 [Metarhizium acridum]
MSTMMPRPVLCILGIVLYNSTVAVCDPVTNQIKKTIELDKLSYDPALHSSGVQVNPRGRLSVIVNAGAAFDARGEDISSDNFLKYDLEGEQELWRQNLTAVGVYSYFQDIQHDGCGNSFAVGTWPAASSALVLMEKRQ